MKKNLLTALLFFSITVLKAQTATLRVVEHQHPDHARISIVYETGETEIVKLEGLKATSNNEVMNTIYLNNQKIITETLNKMNAKGYTLTATYGTFGTMFVFTKNK